MKKFLLTFMAVLSGCASQVTTMNVPGIERSDSIQIKDRRPVTERQGEIFSLLVTNDGYATYRIADSAIAPPAIRLLRHRAFEVLGPAERNLDITVHHLVVYRNLQAELRRGAIGAGLGGVIGAVVAGQIKSDPSGTATSPVDSKSFDSLAATEYKRALYSDQENPGHGSVHIIYIETEINGRRLFTRTITPIKSKDAESPLAAAVETSIRSHLSLAASPNVQARSADVGTPPTAMSRQPDSQVTLAGPALRPSAAVHLDADMVLNRTWIYPHPVDEARYGNVELSFTAAGLTATSKRGTSKGTYEVRNDQLCIYLEPSGTTCYFLLEEDGQKKLFFPKGGVKSKLMIR